MNIKLSQACGVALLAISGLLMAGCEANGDGTIDGSDGINNGNGDDNGNGVIDPNEFPNDGTVPTDVTDGGDPDGTPIAGRFICTASVHANGVTTTVGSNGLVGGPLTTLLNLLGGDTATRLLNSVIDKDLVIDGRLSTHSTFSLTLGLLGGLLETVDQTVHAAPGSTVPAGNYAVFGIGLPAAVVDLTLLNTISVTTSRNGVVQETRSFSSTDLDLLGLGTHDRVWLGLKTHQPYDAATVRLTPGLLTANVGEAMYVHELCTGGRFIPAPAP